MGIIAKKSRKRKEIRDIIYVILENIVYTYSMLNKCSKTVFLVLSVQLAMVVADSKVDERYSKRQNNGPSYPENINGAFNPSGDNGYQNSDTKYPGRAGIGYGLSSENTLNNGGNTY